MDLQLFIKWLTQTFLYSIIWILMMALCVYILDKVVSFSIKKEIVEDENVSLWIIYSYCYNYSCCYYLKNIL